MFVLIESEFRSLIRTIFENVIFLFFEKKESKIIEIILKLSIRVISSLITIYIFKFIQKNAKVRIFVSYILLLIFIYFLVKG